MAGGNNKTTKKRPAKEAQPQPSAPQKQDPLQGLFQGLNQVEGVFNVAQKRGAFDTLQEATMVYSTLQTLRNQAQEVKAELERLRASQTPETKDDPSE